MYTHTYRERERERDMYVYIYIYIRVYIHIYIYIYTSNVIMYGSCICNRCGARGRVSVARVPRLLRGIPRAQVCG